MRNLVLLVGMFACSSAALAVTGKTGAWSGPVSGVLMPASITALDGLKLYGQLQSGGAKPIKARLVSWATESPAKKRLFLYRISNDADSGAAITSFTLRDFPNGPYGFDYFKQDAAPSAITAPPVVGPTSVMGQMHRYHYETTFVFAKPIQPGQSSAFLFIEMNLVTFSTEGAYARVSSATATTNEVSVGAP